MTLSELYTATETSANLSNIQHITFDASN